MFCGFSLGLAFGGVATAYLVAEFGWRGVLIIGGLFPLLLVPVLWFTLPESVRFLALGKGNEARIAAILNVLRRIARQPGNATSLPTSGPVLRRSGRSSTAITGVARCCCGSRSS